MAQCMGFLGFLPSLTPCSCSPALGLSHAGGEHPAPSVLMLCAGPGTEVLPCAGGSASLRPTGSNTDLFQRLPHIPSGNPMPPALRTTSVKPRWCKTRHHSPPWRGSGGEGGPASGQRKQTPPFSLVPSPTSSASADRHHGLSVRNKILKAMPALCKHFSSIFKHVRNKIPPCCPPKRLLLSYKLASAPGSAYLRGAGAEKAQSQQLSSAARDCLLLWSQGPGPSAQRLQGTLRQVSWGGGSWGSTHGQGDGRPVLEELDVS